MSRIPQSEAVRIVYSLPSSSQDQRVKYKSSIGQKLLTPTRKRRQKKFYDAAAHKKSGVVDEPQISTPFPKAHNSDTDFPQSSQETGTVNTLDSNTGNDGSYTWDPADGNIQQHSGDMVSSSGASLEDAKFALFIEAVASDQCSFLQLTSNIFVANDWNMSKDEPSYRWVHIQSIQHGTEYKTGCQCPYSRRTSTCFHIRYLNQFRQSKFFLSESLSSNEERTFLCARDETARDGIFDTVFSVPPPPTASSTTIKQRAIVEHRGDDKGEGTWRCTKEPSVQSCYHIVQARHSLRQHLQCDIYAQDEDAGLGNIEYEQASSMREASSAQESVSSTAIPPPHWLRIGSDPHFDKIPPFNIHDTPAMLPLDEHSTCCCQTPRTQYNPFQPTFTAECTIYSLDSAVKTCIQLQKCPSCNHRFIGPDCRELGLFNWNNRTLLTHELLDDYTNQYTTSETPFIAWVTVVARRYETRSNPVPFIGDRLFRAIWFSYIRLVQLNSDMVCPTCGPNPDAVIVDGVTLAFNRKHVLASLSPPTSHHPDSIVKDKVCAIANLQCIPKSKLRSSIRSVLNGPPLLLSLLPKIDSVDMNINTDTSSDSSASESDGNKPNKRQTRRMKIYKAMSSRIKMIPNIINQLDQIDHSLSALFDRCFGPAAFMASHKAPTVYKKLFLQIAAEETCLQLVNGESLEILRDFCAAASATKHSMLSSQLVSDLSTHLIPVPALYHVIQFELQRGRIEDDTLGVCRWLYVRGATVLKMLQKYPAPDIELDAASTSNEKWQETGACYGMPKIRHRPIYPHLKFENLKDSGGKDKRGDGCNKFYSKYGQSRLTGGIMVIWCTHSVCYGFHCIPSAEGRNDVFSAIYTRWKTAPKIIVYDFACALQPYCMTREPAFFAKTLFVIDVFHATGHTKCGQAAFLNNYCATNPELLYINSSAAECGNGGILRIRKPVAYMSQERAIVYTKVFMSIWNRQRIRAMEEHIL